MISCTEFIPAYSELFSYLDEKYGRAEVDAFWDYLFEPTGDGIPLINFVKKEGIRGCYSYWAGTLNEEAASFTMYFNEKRGYYQEVMHKCPSKGRLLALKDEIGIEPYKDYCLHCDCYRAAIEKVGLKYIYNFAGTDHASCSMLIYDPKVFDGRVIVDEDTIVMHREDDDNEYFHRDFHSSMNMGIEYLGKKGGLAEINAYLDRYVKNVYKRELSRIRENGLDALKDIIFNTYEKEKATDAVSFERKDGSLVVRVAYCPAVKHLLSTGRTVSSYYRYTTESVMAIFAKEADLDFTMISYDEETGAAAYKFNKTQS